ncbi:MAG: hypothetical protein PVJ43_02150 [Gemmatimonadales bacterium]
MIDDRRPALAVTAGRGGVRGIALFVLGYGVVDLLPIVLPEQPHVVDLPFRDAADAALIFLLVFLYVELATHAQLLQKRWARAVFALALLLMVQGHAIHLAANAIAAASEAGSSGWSLIYFLDERWGHTELHFAFLLLAALFIGRSDPVRLGGPLSRMENVGLWVLAAVYGLLLAGGAIEGQTVPLMLPGGVLLSVWGLWPYLARRRPKAALTLPAHRRFFAASLGVTAIALAIYGLAFPGYPQFSGG